MEELVRDLTDAVRIQEGSLRLQSKPIDLVALTSETVELEQVQTDGQTINLEIEAAALPVNGDAERLQQVLLNLLLNAFRYAADSERIDVRLKRQGDFARLEVQDYGPGIPAADQEQIFSRFYQVSSERQHSHTGLGLGLFIVREIIRAHGGTIEVRSVEGAGAVFVIRLPLLPETEAARS